MNAGPVQSQVPDYSAGVKKLFQLGLPDTRDAKYVRIESRYGGLSSGGMLGRGAKMTGNAWLLETRTNGTSVVLINQLNVTDLIPTKVMEQQQKARMEAMAERMKSLQNLDEESLAGLEFSDFDMEEFSEMSRQRSGDWKEADLQADIQSLTNYLTKVRREDDWELNQSAGAYLLFAAHVHTRGLNAEASQIIALLFQKVGDSRKVLSAAMSQIADAEYAKVYQAFTKSGDWTQYLAAMEGLTGRFSKAWHNGPLVERVAASVRKQLDQNTPATISGEGVSEADDAVARMLGETNTVIPMQHAVFNGLHWLTMDPAPAGARQKSKQAPGPLDLIQQRGGASIPLLIAMLKDGWLVRTKGDSSERFFSGSMGDEAMSEEEMEQRLEYFSRPISRGEIARRILEPLVIDRERQDSEENRPTLDELAQKSRAWREKHSTTNRSELMRQLLAEGRQDPLHFLMSSTNAADRAAVEAYLMNTNRLVENLQSVTQYAQSQGAEVKDFVQKYLAELRKKPSLVPRRESQFTDARYLKQREEQAKTEVKALEDLISDKTAEQMLQELTNSEKKWNAQEMYKVGTAINAKLAREDPDKALTLLLQACLRAKDDELGTYLVQSASSLRWAEMRQRSSATGPPPKPREFKVETHAELWKQVLAQKRTASTQRYWGGRSISFEAQVASALETFYSDAKDFRGQGGMSSAQHLGDKIYDVTILRAHARLAGKPASELPAYPDKAKVSKERTAQIGQLLRDSTTENQHAIPGKLTLDELVALPDIVAADAKLNEKLAPGSHVIEQVRVTLTNSALTNVCLSLKGKALDRKALESIIAECKKQAEQGSNFTVMIERRLPLAGVSLSVGPALDRTSASAYSYGRTRDRNEAMMTAMLSSEGRDGLYANMTWPVKLAAAPKPDAGKTGPARIADEDLLPEGMAGMGEYFKRQEEEFWSKFEQLFEPTRDVCQPYTCTLTVQRLNPMEEE